MQYMTKSGFVLINNAQSHLPITHLDKEKENRIANKPYIKDDEQDGIVFPEIWECQTPVAWKSENGRVGPDET